VDLVWGWGFLSRELFLLLWALIFAIAGAYLLGWIRVKGHGGETTSGRMLAATGFLLFAGYCWHGYRGNEMDSIMTAIIPPYSSGAVAGGHASAGSGAKKKEQHEIVTDDFEGAKRSALAQSRPVLINFTGFT
jgi:thiol:disulfide interchange protein DsbD